MVNDFQNVRINGSIYNNPVRRNNQKIENIKLEEYPNDEFVYQKANGTNDGKFTFKEALKNFGKGIISPIKALVERPLLSLGMIVATVAACSVLPVLAPIMLVGFGTLSVYQMAKGGIKAISEYRQGNYDNSEKAFQEVGAGFIGTALTALGVRQSAKVAVEAKTMSKLNVTVLDAAQKQEIAAQISSGSRLNALKENLSILTSKEGLKAVGYQFKPSMLKARFQDIQNTILRKKVEKPEEIKTKERVDAIEKFKKSEEGIRRAGLTDAQIKAEARILFDKAFDEADIPKSLRPKLTLEKGTQTQGGSYNKMKHEIKFNPESYKSGVFEIDDVIMHEATHCKEALLRASLPQDKVDALTREALIERIKLGESEKIVKSGSWLGPDTMEPPKMSAGMKESFIEFADDVLYKKDTDLTGNLNKYSHKRSMISNSLASPEEIPGYQQELAEVSQKLEPVIDRLKKILDKNPDFVAQYQNSDEALNVLMDYSLSHNTRYNWFTNVKIGDINPSALPPMTPEKTVHAVKSLQDYIATIEGNARISGFNGLFAGKEGFNQYQFSPEEVLCQQEGNKFLVKNLTDKMQEMKQAGTLSAEQEAYMASVVDKAKLVVEYKTKGLEYYEAYTRLINNPNDLKLAETVKTMETELQALSKLIKPDEMQEVIQIVTKLVSPDKATVKLPLNFPATTGYTQD